MDKSKIQSYLKDLVNAGFDSPKYEEIIDMQRIIIKHHFFTKEKAKYFIAFYDLNNLTFDIGVSWDEIRNPCLLITIEDKKQ